MGRVGDEPHSAAARLPLAWRLMTKGMAQAAAKPSDSGATEPSLSRHLVPLFSRLGCNAGAYHGAVQGEAGFRSAS